jgi:hypothetical protein
MRCLAPYPFKEKNEILDFRRIPAGRYELNFRPPSDFPSEDIRKPIAWLWLVAVSATVCIFLLRYIMAPFLDSTTAAGVALGIGIILAATNLLTDWCPKMIAVLFPDRKATAVILLALPLVVWLIAVVSSRLDVTVGSYLLLGLFALPILLRTADLMTTHAVYWMSANPRIDGVTMKRWRTEWGQRFGGIPREPHNQRDLSPQQSRAMRKVRNLRDEYVLGYLLVALAIAAPAIVAFMYCIWGNSAPLGAMIVVGQIGALVLVASYRTCQGRTTIRLFARALEHWLSYGQDRVLPPWVFQSPGGFQLKRKSVAALTIFVLAISVVPLGFADTPATSVSDMPDDAISVLTCQWTNICREDLSPALEALLDGHFMPMVFLLTLPVAATAIPVLYFLLVTYAVAAPALLAHHLALDGPGALEQHQDWTPFDGYSHRLASSNHPEEGNSVLLGFHPDTDYPILLDVELLREHMHVLGATGTSKTALGLSTLATQLIRRGDGPVIVLDCKGDPALFHTVRIEAERANRKFKWFTNRLHRSTYVFNPFNQKHLEGLTLPEYVGLFMMALNLHHGEDYGRAWFSAASRRLFQRALQHLLSGGRRQDAPIDSFRELEQAILQFSGDDYEYRAALHLAFIVQSLSQFEQLNLSPRSDADNPAIQHAIHMPDVIRQQQVVYFSLVGATDIASVAQIAKLAVYSALMAAMTHRELYGERPKIYLICDEAQTIVGQNIQNVLAQAREHGLACVLAHQTMSQLNPPGGVDLRELVSNCTCVKQIFTARDLQSKKFISDLSGRVGYYTPSWSQLPSDIIRGHVSFDRATANPGFLPLVEIRQEIGPRLTDEDIADINRDANRSMVVIERNAGCSAFIGGFPVHTDWPISKDEYDERHLALPWPAGTDATIEQAPFWPAPNGETVTPTHHPAVSGPGDRPEAMERLREMGRALNIEE